MAIRHIPLFNNVKARTFVGLLVALLSPIVAAHLLRINAGGATASIGMALLFWGPAVLLTDKYVHKYPQRYYSYLIACHFKGLTVMSVIAFVLWLFDLMPFPTVEGMSMAIFILFAMDLLLSLPRRRDTPLQKNISAKRETSESVEAVPVSESTDSALVQINTTSIINALPKSLSGTMGDVIRSHLPRFDSGIDTSLVLDDIDDQGEIDGGGDIGLLIGVRNLNTVSRLNNYLRYCSSRVAMGGYLAVAYLPMETVLGSMKARYPARLYPLAHIGYFMRFRAIPKLPWLDKLYFHPMFSWFDRICCKVGSGRNRAITQAEVWGRLAYYGMEVLHEAEVNEVKYVIAQRVAEPVANRKPSYYAVVALEKVGLDGKVIRLHKVRSMYPFSEFLQKKIFKSHGLSNTGKFKNDFRLTDYGPLIRKNWIDEIPGIYDWLRGDVKLVGMRATSPHYLSLYPQKIYDLYIQVKPGLVPPIFDENTTGFDEIVRIESEYLTRYLQNPIKTDILYFWYTFRDIFIRKVRSK